MRPPKPYAKFTIVVERCPHSIYALSASLQPCSYPKLVLSRKLHGGMSGKTARNGTELVSAVLWHAVHLFQEQQYEFDVPPFPHFDSALLSIPVRTLQMKTDM
eukprot:2344612-Amphidinium_carterae.1